MYKWSFQQIAEMTIDQQFAALDRDDVLYFESEEDLARWQAGIQQ